MSAAARSPLLHPAARFAKRHNVLAVRVPDDGFQSDCSKLLARNDVVSQCTFGGEQGAEDLLQEQEMGPVYCARSRSAFARCWLGRVRSALQCSDLTHRLPFGCSALDEKARADTKIVFARRWLPQDARARALALECFSSAVTSFYRHKERIELTGGRSVASRSKRRPAWTPRTSLHARWLLWGARLGVVEEELIPSPRSNNGQWLWDNLL